MAIVSAGHIKTDSQYNKRWSECDQSCCPPDSKQCALATELMYPSHEKREISQLK